MGGYGSGRESRRPVEDQSLELRFDRGMHQALADIRASGGATYRGLAWSINGHQVAACMLYLFPEHMVLCYTVNGEERRQSFPVVYTPTPYGDRPWWQCKCGRRCLRLYNPHGYAWLCRHCWQITYRSSCESDKRLAYGRIWGAMGAAGSGWGCSTGTLITALKAHDRARAKIDRDIAAAYRASRKGTKGGRPRK